MRVDAVMTVPAITIEPTASIGAAAQLMLGHRISGLPVVAGDGTLVGMVSEGDFLRRIELDTQRKRPWWLEFLVSPGKVAADYVQSHGRKVAEVMAANVATVTKDATLGDVVALMGRRRIKRLPVVEDGRVVGIVTRADLLRAMAHALPGEQAQALDDRQIRAAIVAELAKQSWNAAGLISVRVEAGAVELRGTVFDERERRAARVVAENVPGVTSVIDHLVWIEPVSGLVLPAAEDWTEKKGATGS